MNKSFIVFFDVREYIQEFVTGSQGMKTLKTKKVV